MDDAMPEYRTVGDTDILKHNGRTARVFRPHDGAGVWAWTVSNDTGRILEQSQRTRLSDARADAASRLGVPLG